MLVVALLSLIVIALMGVFSSTQRAFRASITQTDVLEGGRAAMDLMTGDMREMSPSFGNSNVLVSAYYSNTNAPVNFFAGNNFNYTPLMQPLVASSSNRVNVLQTFFVLSKQNLSWTGTGYAVDPASTTYLYPLYRFSMQTNAALTSAKDVFNIFLSSIAAGSYTNSGWSHLQDGVVGLTVRAFDNNGVWLTNGYTFGQSVTLKNALFLPTTFDETGFYMFSNALPASVEIEMATLEDRTLQRAESLPNNLPSPPPNDRRTLYLQGQAGQVHLFRQRVTIPNVDPAAYQ
jgi:hypothetical protein